METNDNYTLQQIAEYVDQLDDRQDSINIFKYNRDTFAKLHHEPVRSPHLSFKAKGLLLVLLDNVKTWNVCLKEISSRARDGICATRSGINELSAAGYVYRYQSRGQKGRFGAWITLVFESPDLMKALLPRLLQTQGAQEVLPESGFPHSVIPHSENRTLIRISNNNNKTKTKTTTNPPTPQRGERGGSKNFSYQGKEISLSQATEVFNKSYPSQGGEENVGKHLARSLKTHSLEALISAIEAQKDMHARVARLNKFLPCMPIYGSNWLWKKRYLDPILTDAQISQLKSSRVCSRAQRESAGLQSIQKLLGSIELKPPVNRNKELSHE
jgi:hypothetical protein